MAFVDGGGQVEPLVYEEEAVVEVLAGGEEVAALVAGSRFVKVALDEFKEAARFALGRNVTTEVGGIGLCEALQRLVEDDLLREDEGAIPYE